MKHIKARMGHWIKLLKIILLAFLTTLNVFEISSEIRTSVGKRRANFNGRISSLRLLWSVTTNPVSYCISQCNTDVKCASVFFNKNSGQCRGHSITFADETSASFEQDSRYYVMSFGEHYIGDSCVTSSDCWTPNAECRQGTCLCIPGYSFSSSTHECTVCSVYGNEFMEVQNYWISGYNTELIYHVMPDQCEELCRSRTNYVCVTYEVNISVPMCSLQGITKLQVPLHSWSVDNTGSNTNSYFQRDCA